MKYLRFISIALPVVALLSLTGCSEDLNKSDYDYLPDGNAENLPTLTIAVSNPLGSSVEFTGTIELGTYPDSTIMDMGCMCSTDSLFRYGVVAGSSEDFSSLTGEVEGLQSNTDYYARAYVMTKDGMAFSPVVTFKTRIMEELLNYTAEDLILELSNFSSIDKDGDGEDWIWGAYDDEGNEGFLSFSWNGSAFEPENYLLFPSVDIPDDAAFARMSVTLAPSNPKYYAEVFKVVISEEPITADNCRDAAVLKIGTLKPIESVFSFNMPASYNGKTVYLALCHYDSYDNEAIIFNGYTISLIY